MDGRPTNDRLETIERTFLSTWRDAARSAVQCFCRKRQMRAPSRITTVQPSGTKSLLTGASHGWHAPKSLWYIRRIVFPAKSAIALACIEAGYNVVPSIQNGANGGSRSLFAAGCQEWVVEVPMCVPWADSLAGCPRLERLPAISQFGLYMTVQTTYTDHNTSGTIELFEDEIPVVAKCIQDAIGKGYVAVTLSQRSENDQYPQLPIEPISKAEYDRLVRDVQDRRTVVDFLSAVNEWDHRLGGRSPDDGGCDVGCGCSS
jgi:adenosylcobalamin-dependent ribonucleoside-triphosphate reductase